MCMCLLFHATSEVDYLKLIDREAVEAGRKFHGTDKKQKADAST